MFVVRLRDPIQFIAEDAMPVTFNVLDDAAIVESITEAAKLANNARKNFPGCTVDIFDLEKKDTI